MCAVLYYTYLVWYPNLIVPFYKLLKLPLSDALPCSHVLFCIHKWKTWAKSGEERKKKSPRTNINNGSKVSKSGTWQFPPWASFWFLLGCLGALPDFEVILFSSCLLLRRKQLLFFLNKAKLLNPKIWEISSDFSQFHYTVMNS